MKDSNLSPFVTAVLENMPEDWLFLTTHRLDIYNEALAKRQFLDQFEGLFEKNESSQMALSALPTAYDYIRLGHPLSSVLEWMLAKAYQIRDERVISFGSEVMPILAVLRTNLFTHTKTRIAYTKSLPAAFDAELIKNVYGYDFEILEVSSATNLPAFDGCTLLLSEPEQIGNTQLYDKIDFILNSYDGLGSVLIINSDRQDHDISAIQHVRRRETIAMTPSNALKAIKWFLGEKPVLAHENTSAHKAKVTQTISAITIAPSKVLVASSGLSMQYAIMMGLIDKAQQDHPGKAIKFVVPPNCYGGTNDQARRVAACLDHVAIVDLPVDGDNDMVTSLGRILDELSNQDAVTYIIAEIPTNPRVEVPDLAALRDVLTQSRQTSAGDTAIAPVFILDQTFCPNVHFLGSENILADVKTLSYASGSKFPSGGKCTAGYAVANQKAAYFMTVIERHLLLCDNEATPLQYQILAQQLPSMNARIKAAYHNTREFVTFVAKTLPEAKLNFVSETLAHKGFTPSVFSLDLPTKGDTPEERESYKRALNLKLIEMMITALPKECKYCVSYGQLKGSYWTIPATSTQGTTKEGDKDYIVRASMSPDMDLEKHKAIFAAFVATEINGGE
ncbi:MAG: cystathionine beta-synthase [Dokdonia sp.]|jgi:cystathionine beta-lyase/cystathionine gamma-synthase